MKKHLNTLYVTQDDSLLSKDGETICISRHGTRLLRLPLHNLEAIQTFGWNIAATPQLLAVCAERGICLSQCSPQGKLHYRICGFTPGNVLLRRQQYRLADSAEGALSTARLIVTAKILNARKLLQRHRRDHSPDGSPEEQTLRRAEQDLARAARLSRRAENSQSLLGIEGAAAESYFGSFGGRYVPETLMPPLLELEDCYERIMSSPAFRDRLQDLLHNYCGRPTPITRCDNLSADLGFELYLKREDLLHTGAHKINNAIGQTLLAHLMGKTHVIAETGAGQHGVATATAAAKFGMRCTIFMGARDVERQAPNVQRMKLLGAQVVAVQNGSCTLKDAINEALRAWIAQQQTTAPLPDDCARAAECHRPRVHRADARADGLAAGLRRGLRGRRLERHRHDASLCPL